MQEREREGGSGEATSVSSRVVLLNWKVAAGFGWPPPALAPRWHYLHLTERCANSVLRVAGVAQSQKKIRRLATEPVSRQLLFALRSRRSRTVGLNSAVLAPRCLPPCRPRSGRVLKSVLIDFSHYWRV